MRNCFPKKKINPTNKVVQTDKVVETDKINESEIDKKKIIDNAFNFFVDQISVMKFDCYKIMTTYTYVEKSITVDQSEMLELKIAEWILNNLNIPKEYIEFKNDKFYRDGSKHIYIHINIKNAINDIEKEISNFLNVSANDKNQLFIEILLDKSRLLKNLHVVKCIEKYIYSYVSDNNKFIPDSLKIVIGEEEGEIFKINITGIIDTNLSPAEIIEKQAKENYKKIKKQQENAAIEKKRQEEILAKEEENKWIIYLDTKYKEFLSNFKKALEDSVKNGNSTLNMGSCFWFQNCDKDLYLKYAIIFKKKIIETLQCEYKFKPEKIRVDIYDTRPNDIIIRITLFEIVYNVSI